MRDRVLKRLVKEIKSEFGISLNKKFINEVNNPVPILRAMVNTAMNWRSKKYDTWEIGKQLQFDREKNYNIPFKTELEVSAGLWYLIYEGKV